MLVAFRKIFFSVVFAIIFIWARPPLRGGQAIRYITRYRLKPVAGGFASILRAVVFA